MGGQVGEPRKVAVLHRFLNFFRDLSISSRMIISFLLISLIPLLIVTYISYKNAENEITREVTNSLDAIAIRQSSQIEAYVKDKELIVTALGRDPAIVDALVRFDEAFTKNGINSSEYNAIEAELTPFLSYFQETTGFQNLYLISTKGDAIFSLTKGKDLGTNFVSGPFKDTDLAQVFSRATTLLETDISDFKKYPATNEPAAFIGTPVTRKGTVLGAVVLQLNNSEMYKVVNDYVGLGKTGETIIVSKVGNQGVYMTPTRFDPDAAFHRKFPLRDHEEGFLQNILRGNRSIGVTTDYRGKQVLAVGQYFLPALQWGMMVKVDTDEAFAPIAFLRWLLFFTIAATALLVSMAAYYTAKSITDPIHVLIDKTRVIAGGDLSQRIPITSKNEIGTLSNSFNLMTEKLDDLIKNLDSLVKTRTEEVVEKNVELEGTLQQLKEMQQQIIVQEKLASLGELTAGIAHEIKNPLNFVINFAELSEKQIASVKNSLETIKDRLNEEEVAALDKAMGTSLSNIRKVQQHGARADSILKNMLAHSRGDTSMVFQPTDINALLDENFRLAYHSKRAQDSTFNISMEMKFDESIGQVDLLPQEFGRVIINLLNNSFYAVTTKKKFVGESFLPRVLITTKNLENEKFQVTIYDNGLGIPNDVKEKLFTPFFTTKPPGEGTGLGLSLSREIIVSLHHGDIEIETKTGEFTAFKITIPKKQKKA